MASPTDNSANGPSRLTKLRNRFSRSFSKDAKSNGSNSSNSGATVGPTPSAAPGSGAIAGAGAGASTVTPASIDTAGTAVPAPEASSEAKTDKTSVGAAVSEQTTKADPAIPGANTASAVDTGIDYTHSARSLNGVKTQLRQFYPAHQPYKTGTIKVSGPDEGDHEIYWELSGKQGGQPVVYLHGGPGGGTSDGDRAWFDPSHYQILVFDQRGAGKSTPAAELKGNTTWDLVQDIERLRKEVAQVEKWHVFGGSWGSTLALAYAQKHPDRVSALILRGIFTLRRSELEFFYQEGTGWMWPEQFQPYRDHIPESERSDMIGAYYSRLTSEDASVRLEAARKWSTWENATSKLYLDHEHMSKGEDDKWALQFARIESHFFHHRGWMDDGALLKPENVAKITHIPTVVVQGRYDMVCPCKTAVDLRAAWLQAPGGDKTLEFFMIPDAGHSAKEPGIADKLLYATDKFKSIGSTAA